MYHSLMFLLAGRLLSEVAHSIPGGWGPLVIVVSFSILVSYIFVDQGVALRRATLMGTILGKARARLPGEALTLNSGSVVYEVGGLFIGLESQDAGFRRLRVSVSGAPYGVAVDIRTAGRRSGGKLTGDPLFDAAIRVEGPALETMARLDFSARAAVRAALDGGSLKGGVWSIDLDVGRYNSAQDATDDAVAWIDRFLAAARVWGAPSTPAASLKAIARTDPVPGVRARALLMLATIDPSLTVARQLAGSDGLASADVDRIVAAALIAQVEGAGADVPALRAAAARLGASPERDAVALAIEAIRARVGPASVGALSVGLATGDLSAAAEGGELARAEARDRGGPP